MWKIFYNWNYSSCVLWRSCFLLFLMLKLLTIFERTVAVTKMFTDWRGSKEDPLRWSDGCHVACHVSRGWENVFIQSREKKAQGRSYLCALLLKVDYREDENSFLTGSHMENKRQWVQVASGDILPGKKKEIFDCKNNQSLE